MNATGTKNGDKAKKQREKKILVADIWDSIPRLVENIKGKIVSVINDWLPSTVKSQRLMLQVVIESPIAPSSIWKIHNNHDYDFSFLYYQMHVLQYQSNLSTIWINFKEFQSIFLGLTKTILYLVNLVQRAYNLTNNLI